MEPQWKQEIRRKLVSNFERQPEKLIRIFWYLDEEDKAYRVDPRDPPVWATLRTTLYSDNVFTQYAQRLAEDTKRSERDASFRSTMGSMYNNMMGANDSSLPDDQFQRMQLDHFRQGHASQTSAFMGLAAAWEMIPPANQAEIIAMIPRLISNRQLVQMVDDVVGAVTNTGATVVMVTLAAVYLSFEALKNINRWWKGEISGKRCAKNIVDATFSVGAGMAGGYYGAMAGSFFGPIGTLLGGVIGGALSSAAMAALSDRITQTLFGVPKEEALENAYNYLGVRMGAANNDINKSFRQLCLKNHPDKPGGSKEEFHILQLHMAVIKQARGELI